MNTTGESRVGKNLLFCTMLVLLGLAACSSPGSGQTSPDDTVRVTRSQPSQVEVFQTAQLFPIEAGDLIDVEIYNTPELSGRLRVDTLGQVTLPLGGAVTIQGVSVGMAASIITERLRKAQIMLDPKVTISVAEYATEGITIVGEVRSPGTYTLYGSHTLYDALAAAGGASASEGASITITHSGDAEHPIVIKVSTPNYSATQKATLVQPGDTIVVSRADLVYIVGDVLRTGAFYMQSGQPLTILNLVSLAQGTNRTAAMGRASIVRSTADGAITIPFNLNKVMKNQEPNLTLQAGDILVLPRSGWKDFGLTALPGITNAAAGAVSTEIITH